MNTLKTNRQQMRIGIVGCGHAGDTSINSIKKYPHLQLVAVTDRDQRRLAEFAAYYSVKTYPTVDAILADPSVEDFSWENRKREYLGLVDRLTRNNC